MPIRIQTLLRDASSLPAEQKHALEKAFETALAERFQNLEDAAQAKIDHDALLGCGRTLSNAERNRVHAWQQAENAGYASVETVPPGAWFEVRFVHDDATASASGPAP